MMDLLWLVPFFPLMGFVLLLLLGGFLSRSQVVGLGVGTIILSALTTLLVGFQFLSWHGESNVAFTQTLWSWISVGNFRPEMALYLDSLSLLMIFVVTFVGSLIAIYASEFMEEYGEERRFFAAMNLFIANMLMLVLGNNLLVMYLGWEGVGLCSYLLIGFWYKDPANGRASRKAFITTRVGDTAFAIGLFLLFTQLHTLNIQEILKLAAAKWSSGDPMVTTIALLLLGGAVGKSAQFPLQTWLPDAMVGPTPVSALIHAATMVTAGVYLIARTNVIFTLSPLAQGIVASVGALTLLLAGMSALVQRDLKRVLAYSTISQIGYMFLALGVGAYQAAMFHFMTHAFFKALLFLGAGVIGHCLHHEYDMFKMGGVRKQIPLIYWMFIVGGGALAALPLVTSGFYSKDLILWEVFASEKGGVFLWAIGVVGAFITALYTFRMIFITFFGEPRHHHHVEHLPGKRMAIPLIVLSIFAVIAGFVETPASLGGVHAFTNYIHHVLPETPLMSVGHMTEILLQLAALVITLAGVFTAYVLYLKKPFTPPASISPFKQVIQRGWDFDKVYDFLFVRPYTWAAKTNKDDFIDLIYKGLSKLAQGLNSIFVSTQTGRIRHYATGIALGAVILIGIMVIS